MKMRDEEVEEVVINVTIRVYDKAEILNV